jgi:type I restriction enzyme M protein
MKPDFRKSEEFLIHDPACGTGGFLIGAFEWIKNQTKGGSQLSIKEQDRLLKKTFSGMDIVVMTRRLALMNCFLHSIEPKIYFGDALGEGPHVNQRYNVVMTNPPFGSKGAGGAPGRDDFISSTSNKQLNFIQHIITILKPGGNASMVVPDNVLFDNSGKKIREHLLKMCNLHTILRLPEGTFQPYAGVKANVIFFTRGKSTEEIWYYDLRTNVENINKGNPLTKKLFEDFEKCYDEKPRKSSKRFKQIKLDEIKEKDFNLDISIMEDDSRLELNKLPEPKILAEEISKNLQTSLNSINKLIKNLKDEK